MKFSKTPNARLKTLSIWLICLMMIQAAAFASPLSWLFGGKQEPAQPQSGALKVWLRSLGDITALGITLDGSYSVEGDSGFRFERGTVLTAAVDGESIYLKCGGLTLDMGAALTLTRHATDGNNGMYIHGTERDNLYNGDLELNIEGGKLRAILVIDIEEYLYGVVPYEMSDSFPLEALKAQAVAARTYALRRRESNASRAYHVVDTTQDQVFKGFDPDCENAISAVNDTRGVCGLYNGSYATCFYTASNGGQTALANDIWGGTSADYDYLAIKDDPYDLENPMSVVRSITVPADGALLTAPLKAMLTDPLSEALAAMGYSDEAGDYQIDRVLAIEPHEPMNGELSRRYTLLKVTLSVSARPMVEVLQTPSPSSSPAADPSASPVVIGFVPGEMEPVTEPLTVELTVFDQIKRQLGLQVNGSDYELVSVATAYAADGQTIQSFAIQMRRFGHGVGMSQRGAEWMAELYGKRYTEILSFYYPGMELATQSFATIILPGIGSLPSSLGAARARPTPRPTQAPLPALEPGEYYAGVTLGSRASSLNVREQPSTGGSIIAVLYSGDRVIVTQETQEGWARVRTAELTGYVSLDYLTRE